MGQLVLASGNPGKLREFGQLLAPKGWEIVAQAALGVTETDEPFGTFVENALRKARNASKQTGLPALADDSGICVPLLDGAPGVYSARYASLGGQGEGDSANNAYLIAQLQKASRERQAHQALGEPHGTYLCQSDIAAPNLGLARAYYYCVLVWVDHFEDPCPKIAEGRWWGEVLEVPRGQGGFGYDAHFLIPEFGLTTAQMSAGQKNEHSHRAQALRRLLDML